MPSRQAGSIGTQLVNDPAVTVAQMTNSEDHVLGTRGSFPVTKETWLALNNVTSEL
jgi:hypothetical protein